MNVGIKITKYQFIVSELKKVNQSKNVHPNAQEEVQSVSEAANARRCPFFYTPLPSSRQQHGSASGQADFCW